MVKKTISYLINVIPDSIKKLVPNFLKKKVNEYLYLNHHISDEPRENIGYDDYHKKWAELFGERLEDYFKMHKLRYYELLNTLKHYVEENKNPSVLEIGVSEFVIFYKYFFPHIELVTVDRPKELNGFDTDYCLKTAGAKRHYHIDLNRYNLSPDYGNPPLGVFDFIICTEVLEHLIVNPVEFINSLMCLLKVEGYLYLTTPNFFRYDNINKLGNRINPQMVFPGFGRNQDAHHHYREYDMKELLQFIDEGGGEVIEHYYSGCWDNPELLKGVLEKCPEQKSNLVMVIKKKVTD